MTTNLPLSLVDPDPRNRALFVRTLAQVGRHVEPYEDAMELDGAVHYQGVYLTCDTGDLVEKVIATINPQANAVALIAYTDQPTPGSMFRAIRSGAVNYLAGICSDREQLLEAIQLAELSIVHDSAKRINKPNLTGRVRQLTDRERQILEFLASGSTSREIGKTLGISPRTVEIHRANMQTKLNALNSAHAVRIGLTVGLIS